MAFTDPLILQYIKLQTPIIQRTDATHLALSSILNEFDGFRIVRLVNFYSLNCSAAKQNYDTYDWELLVMV